jgi:hypothetical protein
MTNPKQPDSGESQTSAPRTRPTPEDPREHEPMRDPPIYPEHDDDDDGEGEVRQAGGIEAAARSPDAVVYDDIE